MVKTRTSKRSLSAYDIQRIILGSLLTGLIISGVVFVYQTRDDNSEIGDSIIVEQDPSAATPTEPNSNTEGEQ